MRKKIHLLLVIVVMTCLFSLGAFSTSGLALAEPLHQEGTTLTGWLNILYGDGPEGSKVEILLSDSTGTPLAELIVPEDTAREYNRQFVQVSGDVAVSSQGAGEDSAPMPATIVVTGITPAGDAGAQGDVAAAGISGELPFINLLCRFANNASTPQSLSWYEGLLGGTYPGLDHYWREISYDNINLNGSDTMTQWVVLPRTRAGYLYANGDANLGLLAQDCTKAADAQVDFTNFVGINMMFNDNLDCCAWGGTHPLNLDGEARIFMTTWMPAWSDLGTLAHEMGHTFGFPHSSGPSWNPPTGLGVYQSLWDVMSDSVGTCLVANQHPVYDCVPAGTISYHLDLAGWIPPNRKVSVYPDQVNQVIAIERLRQPPSANSILMVKVPIGGSALHFFTIEARMMDGYDINTPGVAVIIHEVNRSSLGNAGDALVVTQGFTNDINDAPGRWLPGETYTYTDENGDDIIIEILSQQANGFTVRVTNNTEQVPYPDEPTNVRVTSMSDNSITVEWDDNSNNEDGFGIYRASLTSDFFLWDVVGPNVTTYTDSGLTCGQLFFYGISAYNEDYETYSDFADYGITTPCKPILTAPTNNSTSSTGRPILRWNSPGYSDLTYDVYLDTNPNPTTLVATVTSSSYQFPGNLTIGTYYWRVQATNEFGASSPLSDVGSFSIVSPPGAAPAPIYFTTDTPELTWNRVSWAAKYEIQVENTNTFAAPYEFSAEVPGDQLSVTTTPLINGTYYWRVRAINAQGVAGAWSTPQMFVIDS